LFATLRADHRPKKKKPGEEKGKKSRPSPERGAFFFLFFPRGKEPREERERKKKGRREKTPFLKKRGRGEGGEK